MTEDWLRQLALNPSGVIPIHDKHFNDPIWGTITLYPWEVALLDTVLVQRLRGVKQLGLAHLVFPTATHDRFSHVCGVVEAVERLMDAITRNTNARRRTGPEESLPKIYDSDRYVIRLAALIHDMGHGPFSHAIEPVIARLYANEIRAIERVIQANIDRVHEVQVSEAIAVLILASPTFRQLLRQPFMNPIYSEGTTAEQVLTRLISAVVGGSDGTARGALGALVSSQIDADKLDYMARDAYHAGLPIDFDTGRLISKIETLLVEEHLLSPRLDNLRERAQGAPNKRYNEIGISTGGTGAFEQMLVGRIFLYDRLYHHHKVRAADAMAQRLVYYADPNQDFLSVPLLYAPLSDDTIIRAFGGLPVEVAGPEGLEKFPVTKESSDLLPQSWDVSFTNARSPLLDDLLPVST